MDNTPMPYIHIELLSLGNWDDTPVGEEVRMPLALSYTFPKEMVIEALEQTVAKLKEGF